MLNVEQLEVLGNDELNSIFGGELKLTPEQQAIILASQIGAYAMPGNPVLNAQIATAATTTNVLNVPPQIGFPAIFLGVTPRPLPPQKP